MNEVFYSLKPFKTDLHLLLDDIRNYRVKLSDIAEEMQMRKIESVPAIMKTIRIICEFNDNIV
jgi:hypothetical protein